MWSSIELIHYIFFIKKHQNKTKVVHCHSFLPKTKKCFLLYMIFFKQYCMQKGFLEAQQAVILSIKSPSLVLLNVLFQSVINCYKKKFSAWVIVKFSFFKKLLRAFTVIRSPFVYKSSREQLCIVTYQAKLFLQMENFYIADYLEFFLVKVLFLKLSSVKHVIIRKLSNNFIYY